MFTVSKCDLFLNTLTSHDSAHIRGRPTLKDAERFRTGSIIHESKNTFGYIKTCINNCQKCYTKSCQKYNTKSEQKCDKSTTEMTNINTQINLQQTNVNLKPSCCTVNEHMVTNLSIMLNKDDVGNKNVSIDQCVSGINISNCISEFDQNKIISPSKSKARRIRKLPVRSRHALFYNVCTQKLITDFTATGCHLRHRDREPSRIQVKWLTRKFGKSRLLRKHLRHKIKRSVPKSSHLHYILDNIKHCQNTVLKCIPDVYCPKKVEKRCRTKLSAKDVKFYVCEGILADIFYLSGPTCDLYAQQVYKNVNHLKNVCQSALCTDIETNPGPVFYTDPSKTISAPYSQGNQIIFGETAGQQCLAMCLCALIYNKRQKICTPQDLVHIMNIGNELYSNLSRLARQSFLLLTELPSQLAVFKTNFAFEYSESYSGNVIGDCSIEGYQYCVPFHRSFELLMVENYCAFILTIDSNAVCIFSTTDGKYNIFDSHSRDIYGRSHPQGTCVLLEAPNIDNVILYFQSLYSENSQFELRGINIEEVQANFDPNLDNNITNSDLSGNTTQESKSIDISGLCRQCCAISLYSICYSVIKSCTYWDSNTVSAVVYFGTTLYNNTGIHVSGDIPRKVEICGTEIHVKLQANIQGVFIDKAQSKLNIESLISHTNENTGFLIWLEDYCMSCIFQKTSIKNMSYSLLAYDDDDSSPTSTVHFVKNIKDKYTLVDAIFNLANTKIQDEILNYEIQFLSCSSELTNCERKRIMKSHRQKKQKLETKQIKYKTTYNEKNPKILENRRTIYEVLDKSKKEEVLTKNLNYKKTISKEQKQKILEKKRVKYKTLDQSKKEELLTKNMSYKKTMKEEQKHKLLQNKRAKYQVMDPQQKNALLNREKEKTMENNSQIHDIDMYIDEFKRQIKAGPFYICCVCNRTLYKKSVITLQKNKYPRQDCFMIQCSFDGKEYVCKTCHGKLRKGQQPCQAAVNNLSVDETPTELAALEKLEQILIAQRIVFEKIVVMPKGQQRKIKGAICNVPVECSQTCNVLPRPPDRSGIILLKLKRKLQFRGHVYFQAVRPQFVINALDWLIANNPLYRNIEIQCDNIGPELTNLNCPDTDQENIDGPFQLQSNVNREHCNEDVEEQDDPLNEHRSAASETCLQSILPNYPVNLDSTISSSTGREVFNIAPGEGKHPVSLMTDTLCEELSFPALFPKGRFGYTSERDIKLSPIKYFNARLLHYSGKFATNPEYLFFAQFIMEQKKISDSINIALKKIHGQSVTASQVKSNSQAFQNLLFQDQAYLFLRQIPGSPPYWQKFMYEVVAMVKQLGIPTWFMTLSCADLRWPELFQIIARTNGNNMTDEEVDALSYNERCSMLNLNPVIVAKHFQYRVETFFRNVLLTNANPVMHCVLNFK